MTAMTAGYPSTVWLISPGDRSHVASRNHRFHAGDLLCEGEQEEPRSRGGLRQSHRGQLLVVGPPANVAVKQLPPHLVKP
jgi:hypothetical protein